MRLKRSFAVGLVLWAAPALGPAGLSIWRALHDPGVPCLAEPEEAAWIVVDQHFQAKPRRHADQALPQAL